MRLLPGLEVSVKGDRATITVVREEKGDVVVRYRDTARANIVDNPHVRVLPTLPNLFLYLKLWNPNPQHQWEYEQSQQTYQDITTLYQGLGACDLLTLHKLSSITRNTAKEPLPKENDSEVSEASRESASLTA